jgi:hypothetical protein
LGPKTTSAIASTIRIWIGEMSITGPPGAVGDRSQG